MLLDASQAHTAVFNIISPHFYYIKYSVLHVDLCLSYLYFMSPGDISLSLLQRPLALYHYLLIHILKMNTWVIFNLFYLTFEFDLEWELDLCQTALIREGKWGEVVRTQEMRKVRMTGKGAKGRKM